MRRRPIRPNFHPSYEIAPIFSRPILRPRAHSHLLQSAVSIEQIDSISILSRSAGGSVFLQNKTNCKSSMKPFWTIYREGQGTRLIEPDQGEKRGRVGLSAPYNPVNHQTVETYRTRERQDIRREVRRTLRENWWSPTTDINSTFSLLNFAKESWLISKLVVITVAC